MKTKYAIFALPFTLFILLASFPLACSSDDPISKETLDQSILASCSYLNNSLTAKGNFIYEKNFITGEIRNDDNQVRQAGALWGLCMAFKHHPEVVPYKNVKTALNFYYDQLKPLDDGTLIPVYPGEQNGSTGSLALITLAHIELLTTPHLDQDKELIKTRLDGFIKILISLRQENGQFKSNYSYSSGSGFGRPSPYYDGEALLALSRAAKYCGYNNLVPLILESAEAMYEVNVTEALEEDPDSKTTKGFYQWGSMSFYEIHTAGWVDSDIFAERAINLAYWMIDVHQTLIRTRNTAYAYEGISVSYQLARLTGDFNAELRFKEVMQKGLKKLTSWQVLGPIPNSYLKRNVPSDSACYGGIMNKRNEPWIRIDVVQHQLHATLLARNFLY